MTYIPRTISIHGNYIVPTTEAHGQLFADETKVIRVSVDVFKPKDNVGPGGVEVEAEIVYFKAFYALSRVPTTKPRSRSGYEEKPGVLSRARNERR